MQNIGSQVQIVGTLIPITKVAVPTFDAITATWTISAGAVGNNDDYYNDPSLSSASGGPLNQILEAVEVLDSAGTIISSFKPGTANSMKISLFFPVQSKRNQEIKVVFQHGVAGKIEFKYLGRDGTGDKIISLMLTQE